MEVVVTNGAIRRAKLQSKCHQQTNTQCFFIGRKTLQVWYCYWNWYFHCLTVCCFRAVTIACRQQQFHWFVTCSYLIPRHASRPRKSLISCVPLSSRGLYHF